MKNDKRPTNEVQEQPMQRRKFFASLAAAVAGGTLMSKVTSLFAAPPAPPLSAAPEPFLGEISMVGFNFAPRGWALCDGQLLSIAQHNALFSLLGTIYGGDGRTTFALPDLRGRVPMHAGSGPGLNPRRLGERSGTETNTQTVSQMASHNHPVVVTSGPGNNAVATHGDTNTPIGSSFGVAEDQNGDALNVYSTNAATGATQGQAAVTATAGNTGGSQEQNNLQPYLVVHYVIALEGTFPSRN